VHQAMTWQMSTCHKYLSSVLLMECGLRGMVMPSDVQNAMVSAQVKIYIQTFGDCDSMIVFL